MNHCFLSPRNTPSYFENNIKRFYRFVLSFMDSQDPESDKKCVWKANRSMLLNKIRSSIINEIIFILTQDSL